LSRPHSRSKVRFHLTFTTPTGITSFRADTARLSFLVADRSRILVTYTAMIEVPPQGLNLFLKLSELKAPLDVIDDVFGMFSSEDELNEIESWLAKNTPPDWQALHDKLDSMI